MSKIYKLEEGVILRDGEAIATYNEANGEVDYFEGMAKYRIPVSKWLNKAVKTPKNAQKTPKVYLNETKEPVSDKNWLEYLSAIIGVKLPYPHSRKGWRGTKYRDILMKNYNKIIKSDVLTNDEKKTICNQFL